MKITRNICANILSLLGIVGIASYLGYMFLSWYSYPDYILEGYTFKLFCICLDTYIYVIPFLLISLQIEYMLANKILHKDFFINIQIKNKYLKCTYNVLFWIGFICAILYLMLYFLLI